MKVEDKAIEPQIFQLQELPSLWEQIKKSWQWSLGVLSATLGVFASLPQEIKTWFLITWPWLLERVLPWLIALALFILFAFYLYHFFLDKLAPLIQNKKLHILAQSCFWAFFCLGLTVVSFLYWGFVNQQEAVNFDRSGQVYFEKGELDHALQESNNALEINPYFAPFYVNRGRVYTKKGELDRAIEDFNQALECDPESAAAYNYRGLVFYAKRDFDQAIQDYNKAIELDPKDAEAYNNRGFAYDDKANKLDLNQADRLQDEILNYTEAKNGSEDHKKAIELGLNKKEIILVAQFDGPKEARLTDFILEGLRKALEKHANVEIQPLDQVFNARNGSEMARKIGREQQATIVIWGWYERGKQISPISVHFDVLRNLAYKTGWNSDVYKLKVAQLDSFDFQEQLAHNLSYRSFFTLGLARSQMGDWDGAIGLYTSALSQTVADLPDLKDDKFKLLTQRGKAYSAKGDNDSAIQDYSRAIALKPHDADAYNNRGNAYYRKRDYAAAIQDYSKTIALEPHNADNYNNRGFCYEAKRDYTRAILDYDKAIESNPNEILSYLNRGAAYTYSSEKGKFDAAIQDYAKALELGPNDARVYKGRGDAYSEKGEFDAAIQDYNRSIELNPKFANVYNSRGNIYEGKGEFDAAIQDYSKAIELNPKYPNAYYNRGASTPRKMTMTRPSRITTRLLN
jgi:tetratricopeptide (TPR) repeat protein